MLFALHAIRGKEPAIVDSRGRQVLLRGVAENHGAQSSIADWQGLVPLLCRFAVPEFQGGAGIFGWGAGSGRTNGRAGGT